MYGNKIFREKVLWIEVLKVCQRFIIGVLDMPICIWENIYILKYDMIRQGYA